VSPGAERLCSRPLGPASRQSGATVLQIEIEADRLMDFPNAGSLTTGEQLLPD